MTTYILHGGRPRLDVPSNDDFFKFIAGKIGPDETCLIVTFARESGETAKVFQEFASKLQKIAGRPVTCLHATVEEFPQQFAQARVVYFTGGIAEKLMETMAQWPQAKNWLQTPDKIIVGSSAGMMMLGREYVGDVSPRGQGFGIIPYGTVVHLGKDDEFPTQQDYTNRPRPILMLAEAQFCVIEV